MSDTDSFDALVLGQTDGKPSATIKRLDDADLPAGDVTVAVSYSSLNYKDGMVIEGLGRLVRSYPHVPGIDFAGTVTASDSPDYAPGDEVVLTGWRVGERHWGGYAQRARVRAEWLVPLPDGLTTFQAMALGTAGFTAMLAVMALEDAGISPDAGEMLVTGAGGGLGGVAVGLLAALGYDVTASTGRAALTNPLMALGAARILARSEIAEAPERPLLAERWVGAVDAVGGATLAAIVAQLRYGGAVACCGLAGGSRFETTVIPFLLRGVRLQGIDSVVCPAARRHAAWQRLARDMPKDALERLAGTEKLSALPALAPRILGGQTSGRIVIDVNA